MSEKRGRGQPKFEPTQDQRGQVKQMKALGIPEDRICKIITNPQIGKPEVHFCDFGRPARATGGIHKPGRVLKFQPARQCGFTQARPSKMPSTYQ